MSNAHLLPRGRIWLAMLAFIVVPWLGGRAFAQDDPPGRVGRLVDVQGAVSRYEGEQGQWTDAERNRPLTTGDRLYTDARATAEVRIGSTLVRLSEATELELLRVDDDHIALRLHRGSLALQVRAREVAAEIELVTAEASLRPQRSGLYRLDRADDVTQATALRGALRVDERGGFTIETGQRLELWREGDERGVLRSRMGTPVQDGFTSWVMAEDRRDDAGVSQRYVSPEMTGAEDLDRHGSWEQHPEYGAVWLPLSVGVDWAPYRYGRWAWVQPWGWTWSTTHPGALRPSITAAGCIGAGAGPGAPAATCAARSTRRRWWPGWAARIWAYRSTWARRPWPGCRWPRARSSGPGTVPRLCTPTGSTSGRWNVVRGRRKRCPPGR